MFYNWPRNEVRAISAHSSDAYAVVVCGEELLTIGTDGSVKRWSVDSDEPVRTCEGPERIISAAFWCSQESHVLLLINDTGRAGVYSQLDGRLDLVKRLHGDNFRIAFGPDMKKLESSLRHRKAVRARELSLQIKERLARREYGVAFDELHQELVESGYERVSLALRAEEHRISNDIISELLSYKVLTELLPKEDIRSESSLLRYAALLDTVWRAQEACATYQRLVEMFPENSSYRDITGRLSDRVNIIETGRYAIETDVQLSSLVKAAGMFGEKFTGRYVIKNIGTPVNCNSTISADELVEKYEQNGKAKPHKALPQAEPVELWWLSKERVGQITTVVFKCDDSEQFSYLEYGVKFLNAGLQTVLVRVVMFNADRMTEGTSVEGHNHTLLEQIQFIENAPLSNGWMQMIHRDVNHAIQQLITRSLAGRGR